SDRQVRGPKRAVHGRSWHQVWVGEGSRFNLETRFPRAVANLNKHRRPKEILAACSICNAECLYCHTFSGTQTFDMLNSEIGGPVSQNYCRNNNGQNYCHRRYRAFGSHFETHTALSRKDQIPNARRTSGLTRAAPPGFGIQTERDRRVQCSTMVVSRLRENVPY